MTFLHVARLFAVSTFGQAAQPELTLVVIVVSIAFGVVVLIPPDSWWQTTQQRIEPFFRSEWRLPLMLCLATLGSGMALATRLPIANDEALYFAAAQVFTRDGFDAFIIHYTADPWLGRTHPPLMPLLYGAAMKMLGVDVLVLRLVSVTLAAATVGLTYLICRDLFSRTLAMVAASSLLAMPVFVWISRFGGTDLSVTFCTALAFYLVLQWFKQPRLWLAGAIGLILGLGLLTKYTMILAVPLAAGLLIGRTSLLERRLRFTRQDITALLTAMIAGLAVVSIWVVIAVEQGVVAGQIGRLAHHAGVVSTTRGGVPLVLSTLMISIPTGVGVYSLPFVVLGGFSLLRNRLAGGGFAALWLAVIVLPLFVTLPLTRYMLPAFPALAIMMAWGIVRYAPKHVPTVLLLAFCFTAGTLLLWSDARDLPIAGG